MAAAGFAAAAFPLYLLFRRQLSREPEEIRRQGWPIQLMQVMFTRYVLPSVDVEGRENLPAGSYIVAANHAYKSGVDGFVLGHLLATRAGRVPRIVMTSEGRNWMVRAERWVLHHYGIALLVADDTGVARRIGLSDTIARFLDENDRHSVLIFPAGRAIADPVQQLRKWSTGAVVAAHKARCPVVPVAIGGLRLDWTPETVIVAGMESKGAVPPFNIQVRIGAPLLTTGDASADLETLRAAIGRLMQSIPGLRPPPGEADPAFGKITLHDGRTLAFMDRGPRTGAPVLYFHGFQGSRLERTPGMEAILEKLNVRLISPDRPGIGLSTPARDRTLAGWPLDVAQLTDSVIPGQRFSILGFSAGATYALACERLPGVAAITLAAGLGLPHLIASWRRFSTQTWRILLSARLASFRSATFLKIEQQHRDQVFHHWDTYIADVIKDLSLDDLLLLSRPEVEELLRENRREGYSQGTGYLLQEVQALYSDPNIRLEHLATGAVRIVHGSEDRVVPVEVARDLHRRIPRSQLTELTGRGHYFLSDPAELEQTLSGLVAAGNGAAGN